MTASGFNIVAMVCCEAYAFSERSGSRHPATSGPTTSRNTGATLPLPVRRLRETPEPSSHFRSVDFEEHRHHPTTSGPTISRNTGTIQPLPVRRCRGTSAPPCHFRSVDFEEHRRHRLRGVRCSDGLYRQYHCPPRTDDHRRRLQL